MRKDALRFYLALLPALIFHVFIPPQAAGAGL